MLKCIDGKLYDGDQQIVPEPCNPEHRKAIKVWEIENGYDRDATDQQVRSKKSRNILSKKQSGQSSKISKEIVPEKKHYRPDEVCEILGISKSSFYRKIHSINNPIPAIKFPIIRVPVKEFEEWRESVKIDELK